VNDYEPFIDERGEVNSERINNVNYSTSTTIKSPWIGEFKSSDAYTYMDRSLLQPVDCIANYTQGACDPTKGEARTTVTITRPSQRGGKPCPSTEPTIQKCAVDCQMGNWSDWSACDKPCGGGKKTRSRTVAREPKNEGLACQLTTETQSCNTQACPIDCSMSDWSTWGACDKPCGGGSQTRTRTVITQSQNGGKACPVELSETQSCNTQGCPVDCVVSDWSTWGACDQPCGGGMQSRTQTITRQAENGGKACPDFLFQGRYCNTQACMVSLSVQHCVENCTNEKKWGTVWKSNGVKWEESVNSKDLNGMQKRANAIADEVHKMGLGNVRVLRDDTKEVLASRDKLVFLVVQGADTYRTTNWSDYSDFKDWNGDWPTWSASDPDGMRNRAIELAAEAKRGTIDAIRVLRSDTLQTIAYIERDVEQSGSGGMS